MVWFQFGCSDMMTLNWNTMDVSDIQLIQIEHNPCRSCFLIFSCHPYINLFLWGKYHNRQSVLKSCPKPYIVSTNCAGQYHEKLHILLTLYTMPIHEYTTNHMGPPFLTSKWLSCCRNRSWFSMF